MIERSLTYEEFLEEPARKYIIAFDHGEDVCLDYREEVKKRIRIKNYPWYFCIRTSDADKNQKLLRRFTDSNTIYAIEPDGEYLKLYCRNTNRNVMDPRHEVLVELDEHRIEHFEWDLSSSKRCLVDHKLEIETNYRVFYFDIETDDRNREIIIGKDRIISIAGINQEGRVYYYTGDERKMLKKFLDRIDEYDIITGWNSEKFDVPYIKERLKYHDIYYNWRQILHVDMMQKTMELNKKNVALIKEVRSFSLNAIAKHFLGEHKTELTMGTWEMFEKAPDKLKEYNIQDCVLLKRIDEKLNLIRQKIVEHSITGCFLNEYAVSRILDVYVLRNSSKFGNVRFRSKPARESVDFDANRESNYAGGYVIDPIKGIHKNVYHFDFTSLYPSIIQTFNISPDTWLGRAEEVTEECITTPNHQAYKTKQGIIPKIITDLLVARNNIRFKDMKQVKEGSPEYENLYYKQYAFKTLANSFYGILGAAFTRYYQKENAEAITLSGHYLIKTVKRWFEDRGMTVIYGDTDSVFATADEEVDQEQLHKDVNEFLAYHLFKQFNVVDSQIDLKVEAKYPSMLLVMKKKYIKVIDGKLSIWGMEAKRRETLPLAAKSQIELFEKLLLHNASLEEIQKWLYDLREHVLNTMTKEELVCQVKLSKDVSLYDKNVRNEDGDIIGTKESKLPHVAVAKWLREQQIKEDGRNSWEKGCYVKFIVLEHKPKVVSTSIYNFDGKYDSTWYWNVKVYAILQRVLEVVHPDINWESWLIEEPKKVSKRQQRLL